MALLGFKRLGSDAVCPSDQQLRFNKLNLIWIQPIYWLLGHFDLEKESLEQIQHPLRSPALGSSRGGCGIALLDLQKRLTTLAIDWAEQADVV